MQNEDEGSQSLPEGESVALDNTAEAPAQPANESSNQGTEQNPLFQSENGAKSESEPKVPAWAQARIDEITREKWEARREAERLQRQIDELRSYQSRAAEGQQPEQGRTLTQADVDRIATERAREIAAEQQFAKECNDAYQNGKKDYPDFDDSLRTLGVVGMDRESIEDILATGEGHRVIYDLGKNPEEAARILRLPPRQRIVALARFASKPSEPKPISRAPSPVRPVNGSAKIETDPEKMSMEEWMKWDAERTAQRYKRPA